MGRKVRRSQQRQNDSFSTVRGNSRGQSRSDAGEAMLADDFKQQSTRLSLDWFKPNQWQQGIVSGMKHTYCTLVHGKSGTGKSTTAIWYGLKLMQEKQFRKLVFIKTPSESGDDQIGYLTGDKDTKLVSHFESLKPLFLDFMPATKLDYCIKRGEIVLTVPNYIQGATLKDAIVIIDEAQTMSPSTLKLLLERLDDSCIAVVLGDNKQCYAIKKRDNGFNVLIEKTTEIFQGVRRPKFEEFSYFELPFEANMRGSLSRRVTEIFD